jgi:hypothetical protein
MGAGCDSATTGARKNYFPLTKIFSDGLNLITRRDEGVAGLMIRSPADTVGDLMMGSEEAR